MSELEAGSILAHGLDLHASFAKLVVRKRQVFDEYTVSEDGTPVYAFTQLILPYMPYFSNCRGFDSHIPVYALLENTQCVLPDDHDINWWR